MDDSGTSFVVFGSGDPHGLEGGEGGKDGATDPDRELSLGGSNNLDLHGGGGKGGDFLAESLGDAGEHGGTTGHDDVSVEVLSDIDVALHDGFVGEFVDSGVLKTDERGLEEEFGASESLILDGDGLSVGQLVGLVVGGSLLVLLELGFVVEGDVAELLLDVSDDFSLGGGGEGHTQLHDDLNEPVSDGSSGKIDSADGVGQGVTLIDGDTVGDTITGVDDDTGGSSRGVKGEHGLDLDVE